MPPTQYPTGLVGPGTQPLEPDGAVLDTLAMPAAMVTYQAPLLPEPQEILTCRPAVALLERLHATLTTYRVEMAPVAFELSSLDAANRALLEQTLGDGEVSALITGPRAGRLQETRLAGVWRVHQVDHHKALNQDHLEVAALPGLVYTSAFHGAPGQTEIPAPWPDGVMNAPSVLVEINAQAVRRRPGELPHVINLTLLPLTEQDLALLDQALGHGPVTLLSRGYGNCRVNATGVRNVWWIRYFNSQDQLILDTIEVTQAPAAVLAAQEDIDDSAQRLGEILAALR